MKALATLALLGLTLFSLAAPPAASVVIAEARAKAAKEHKNIFVMFDASW